MTRSAASAAMPRAQETAHAQSRHLECQRVRARELEVLEFVERERPDVLCLQEIKASPDKVPETLTSYRATTATFMATKATRA